MAMIGLKLCGFSVPNFVTVEMPARSRQEGYMESPKLALSELDGETLDELCNQFRDEVFKKAGKVQPPKVLCACQVAK